MEYAIASVLVGLCLLWIFAALQSLRVGRSIAVLEELSPAAPSCWPKLTVIIAACNEGSTIRPALQSLAAQDYPLLETVVVNDRSTDDTGAIIEELAKADPRIRPLHIERLPEGWLGKVHALQRAYEKADSEWLLFTDADVHFAPGALRKTVSYVIARNKDHLALIPKQIIASFWLNVTISAFGGIFLHQTKAAELEKPGSNAFVGSGGFNLVRRAALAKTPGFEWLKMEVVDDVGLGLMLKRHGFTSTLAISTGDISVAWYQSLPDMARGLEKNSFLGSAQGSVTKLLLMITFVVAYLLAPFLALVYPGIPFLWPFGALAIAATLLASVYSARRFGMKLLPAMLSPLGLVTVLAITIRSAWICLRKGGIEWRGTFYPLEELKRQQRVKF